MELAENQWVVLSQQHYYTRELQMTARLKIRSAKLWERGGFDSDGAFASMTVIAVVRASPNGC